MFDSIKDWIMEFIAWALDPVVILATAFKVLAWIISLIGSVLPGDLGDSVETFGANFSNAKLEGCLLVAMYILSPVIPVPLAKLVISARLIVWITTLIGRMVMLIKNHIWSAGA